MDHVVLSKRITDQFAELSPQLQRAARYVLDMPDDVGLMPMRRLAHAAGVNPSTLVRLAKTFGFDTYVSFRSIFQVRLRSGAHDYARRAQGLQSRGDDGLVEEVAEAATANINETIARTGAEKIAKAADALLAARRVYVVGGRSSFTVAYYLEYAMRMFRDDVVLLGERGGTFGDSMRSLQAGDVVLVIAFDPYAGNSVRAVAYARDKGATVVALTDTQTSPIAKGAAHALFVRTESPTMFGSLSAVLAVAESLIALMVRAGGEDVVATIKGTEKQLSDFDAYWQDGDRRRVKRKPPTTAKDVS